MRELPDVLKWLWGRVETRYRVCFFAGLGAGFITHLFMLANKITNLDDIVCVPDVGGGANLGRWLQQSVHYAFSEWASPALNGGMTILFLSLAACLIVAILGIKSCTGAAVTALMLLTFPSTASNMYYMYLAPTFALAILMSVTGVLLTQRLRHGWIAGVILQLLSMACYQAYFALAASLYVLALLLSLFDGEKLVSAARRGSAILFPVAGELYDGRGDAV